MFWNSFEKFIKYFLRTKPKNHVQSGIINFVYVENHKKTPKTRWKIYLIILTYNYGFLNMENSAVERA